MVRDEEGRLIVIAKRDANKSAFLPVSQVEQAREGRFKNRMRNVERRAEEIELERRGTIQLQAAPQCIEISAELVERSDRLIAELAAPKICASPWERYEDLCARQRSGEATDYERQWVKDYEVYSSTLERVGLFLADEFCLKGGEETNKERGQG
jgi:putative transposase